MHTKSRLEINFSSRQGPVPIEGEEAEAEAKAEAEVEVEKCRLNQAALTPDFTPYLASNSHPMPITRLAASLSSLK